MSQARERLAPPEALSRLLYSGSVKDVYGVEGKDPYVFVFSDRYSIFDWGEMPDALAGKGEALAVMGDLFFRQLGEAKAWANWQIPETYPKLWRDSLTSSAVWAELRRSGLHHHSFGMVDEGGNAVAAGQRASRLAVKALKRPPAPAEMVNGRLRWNYSAYESRPGDVLVPLEVVFRFGAPEGSSFLKRAKEIPGYAQSFGWPELPEAGELFAFPIIEFFTKLEPTDRFLTRAEAAALAALSAEEMDELVALNLLIAIRLRDMFSQLGLELWDGKFEFAFRPGSSHRHFTLVDSIGPDELRLIGPGGVHFSKEFLRRLYRDTPWYHAMEKAKKLATERGEKDWKKICREEFKSQPAPLPKEALELAQLLYPALASAVAEAVLKRTPYEGMPKLPELCRRLKELT